MSSDAGETPSDVPGDAPIEVAREASSPPDRIAGDARLDRMMALLHDPPVGLGPAELASTCDAAVALARELGRTPDEVYALRRAANSRMLVDDATGAASLLVAARAAAGAADPEGWAWATWDLAVALAVSGDRDDEVRPLYSAAAESFDEQGDPESAGRVLLGEGEWHLAGGRAPEALDCFERSQAFLRDAGDASGSAEAGLGIAAAAVPLGHLAQAIDQLRRSISIAIAGGDDTLGARAKLRLGELLSAIRDSDARQEALVLLSDALQHAQAVGDTRMAAFCDRAAARSLAGDGQYAEAITLLGRAGHVLEGHGDDAAVLEATVELANLYAADDQVDMALALRQRVLDDLDDDSAERLLVPVAQRQVRDLVRLGRAEEAHRLLERIDPTAVDTEDPHDAAEFHLARAEVFRALGLRVPGREAAMEALPLVRDGSFPHLHARALEFIAQCDEEGDDTEQSLARARSNYADALALYVLVGDGESANRLALRIAPAPVEVVEDDGEPVEEDTSESPELHTGTYL